MKVESQALTIYYSAQSPDTCHSSDMLRRNSEENAVPVQLLPVDSLAQAKQLPCVFNNWAVFYKGGFETVNLLDVAALKRILKK